MKKIFLTLYLFLYCAILVKGLRHYRANMAMSVSISMYTIDLCIFVFIYFKLYEEVSPVLLTIALIILSLGTGYATRRYSEERSIYGTVTARFKAISPRKKILYGALGLIFFLGSFASFIISALLAKWL